MPGPWEKYATSEPEESGPWSKYSAESMPAETGTKPSVVRFAKGLAVNPIANTAQTAKDIGQGLMSGQNPIDRLGWGMVASHGKQAKRAVDSFKRGRYVDAAADTLMALVPGVGPMLGEISERGAKHIQDKDYAALSEDAGEALSAPLLTLIGGRPISPAVKAAAKGGLRGGISGFVSQAESLPTVLDLIPGAKHAKSALGALRGAYKGANEALRPPPLPPQASAVPPPAASRASGGVHLRPGQLTPEQAASNAEARNIANREAASGKDVVRDLLSGRGQQGRPMSTSAPSSRVPRVLPPPPPTGGLTMSEAQYRRGLESLNSRRRVQPEASPQATTPQSAPQSTEMSAPMSRLNPEQVANAEALREWAGDMGPKVEAPPVQYKAGAQAQKVWNIADTLDQNLKDSGLTADALGELTDAQWKTITDVTNGLNMKEWSRNPVGRRPNRHAIPSAETRQQIIKELKEIEARRATGEQP